MSIPSAILSLETLARKAEYTVKVFNSLNSDAILTKEQSHALESAITRISEMIKVIEDKIDCRKEDHAKWVEADGKPLAARAVSAWQKLLTDGRPERVANFSKNITLFFDGPKPIWLLTRAWLSQKISLLFWDASRSVAWALKGLSLGQQLLPLQPGQEEVKYQTMRLIILSTI